jgi:hypothetical protein
MDSSYLSPLEKGEIAQIFGLSLREFAKNLPPEMKEATDWAAKGRKKILPKHFPAIYEHFHGTTEGWKDFFRQGIKR